MAGSGRDPEPRNFAPKDPPKLDPPKDDSISTADLAKCDGRIICLISALSYVHLNQDIQACQNQSRLMWLSKAPFLTSRETSHTVRLVLITVICPLLLHCPVFLVVIFL